jgi:hypothetical protein
VSGWNRALIQLIVIKRSSAQWLIKTYKSDDHEMPISNIFPAVKCIRVQAWFERRYYSDDDDVMVEYAPMHCSVLVEVLRACFRKPNLEVEVVGMDGTVVLTR